MNKCISQIHSLASTFKKSTIKRTRYELDHRRNDWDLEEKKMRS
jgi:hypothetical protein